MRRNLLVTALIFMGVTMCNSTIAETWKWQQFHIDNGVKCNACHKSNVNDYVNNDQCLKCHKSYDALAEKTKDMEINVHQSAHFKNLECTSCHTSHTELKVFCEDCHGPITRDKQFSKIK